MEIVVLNRYSKLFFLLIILSGFFTKKIYGALDLAKKGTVVFIMGPSCSGKSTISKILQNQLSENWVLVEYDEIEDNLQNKHDHELIFKELINIVNNHLEQDKNIIIDTNFFQEHALSRLLSDNVVQIYIYAPLELLLQRDAERSFKMSRNEKRAFYAKEYVIESYQHFYSTDILKNLSSAKNFIDTSLMSKEQAILKALSNIK